MTQQSYKNLKIKKHKEKIGDKEKSIEQRMIKNTFQKLGKILKKQEKIAQKKILGVFKGMKKMSLM